MGDELAQRRADDLDTVAEAGANSRNRVPSFYRWVSTQRHNPDSVLADAVRHIESRWPLTVYYHHGKTLRTLRAESSEFLIGAARLADLYIETFPDADAGTLLEETGTAVPFDAVRWPQCRRCGRESFPGSEFCDRHGGKEWLTDEDRQAVSRHIADKLTEMSDRAMRVLADILDNAKSEKVRADVAFGLLNLNGHSATQKFEIVSDGGPSPTSILLERLAGIGVALPEGSAGVDDGARRLALVPPPTDEDDESEITDAEIVDERPES